MNGMIPVIDLFAGPGGLCEGFSAPIGEMPRFQPVLSIEKDATAHRTLKLRAFVHWFSFAGKRIPDEYYRYVRGEIDRKVFWNAAQRKYADAAQYAERTAWCATLGGNEVSEEEFDRRIAEVLCGEMNWVLIGGPPCQAYSLAGRSRSVGGIRKKGHMSFEKAVAKFGKDERQTLYRQYLRILAVHKPAVFVMENVAGILSARVNGEKIFPKIVSDLSRPVKSAREDWSELADNRHLRYRIFSFETGREPTNDHLEDYLIRAERHGVPQARHRVILLGIRSDFAGRMKSVPRLVDRSSVGVAAAIGDLPAMRSHVSRGMGDSDSAWAALLTFVADSKTSYWKEGFEDVRKVAMESAQMAAKTHGISRASMKTKNPGVEMPEALRQWYRGDGQLHGVLNHAPRGHMASDLERYLFVAAFGAARGRSPVLRDFPQALLPAHRNVLKPGAKGDQAFADRFKVQLADRPSSTVTCHIAKDGHHFIHYDASQCRSLTVREAARLQTFPDNYFFEGNQTEQYHQVGNAVPPFLAAQLADIVKTIFDHQSQCVSGKQSKSGTSRRTST